MKVTSPSQPAYQVAPHLDASYPLPQLLLFPLYSHQLLSRRERVAGAQERAGVVAEWQAFCICSPHLRG
jgi:hypothetical protein